jgi:hypothetical protein
MPRRGHKERIKVDRVDRDKMDRKSVPGVICQVTEQNNYRIVCNGGVLKDCLKYAIF